MKAENILVPPFKDFPDYTWEEYCDFVSTWIQSQQHKRASVLILPDTHNENEALRSQNLRARILASARTCGFIIRPIPPQKSAPFFPNPFSGLQITPNGIINS